MNLGLTANLVIFSERFRAFKDNFLISSSSVFLKRFECCATRAGTTLVTNRICLYQNDVKDAVCAIAYFRMFLTTAEWNGNLRETSVLSEMDERI